MKLLMENWRGYVKKEELFEDYEYITNILGITLPLDESGQAQLTEEVRGQVLREHILYESFIGSLVSAAKKSAGKIKDLLWTLAQILKDGGNLKRFISTLSKNVIKPIAQLFRKAFNKMKAAGGKIAGFIEKISERFEGLLQKYVGMSASWKKAMVGCTLALLLKFSYEKVKGLLQDAINGKVEDELVEFLQEKFVQFFGQGLYDKIADKITDVKSYLGWVGPLVGGLDFIAQTLGPATTKMRALDRGLSL